MDFTASNPRITAPTLVIVGTQDPATPPAAGEAIAKQIKGAKVAALDAAHIANVEQPKHLHRDGAELPPSLEGRSMDEKERHDRGMAQRRKVLGNDWVDRANAKKTPFNSEFQDFITRCAWGEIWTRPHFDERTRRILVIGTMIALGQWDEFRLHVRAALGRRRIFARTTSRKSSCSRRSIAACRRPITPSRKPPKSSPNSPKKNSPPLRASQVVLQSDCETQRT